MIIRRKKMRHVCIFKATSNREKQEIVNFVNIDEDECLFYKSSRYWCIPYIFENEEGV